MRTTVRRRQLLLVVLAAGLVFRAAPDSAASPGWAQALAAGSSAAAKADAASAPSAVSAPCSTLTPLGVLTVTWTAVPHATYAVEMSVDGGGPVTLDSGLTDTLWLTPVLGNHTYAFGVRADIGTNWVSPSATVTRTIFGNGNHCS